MLKRLYLLLENLLGSTLARVLSGAGLSLVTFAALGPAVLAALNAAMTYFTGFTADLAALVAMSGIGVALSAYGSAIMARVAMEAAGVGIKKAAKA